MDLFKEVSPEFALHQMDKNTLLFENEKYLAIPKKYKMLAGILAAAVPKIPWKIGLKRKLEYEKVP